MVMLDWPARVITGGCGGFGVTVFCCCSSSAGSGATTVTVLFCWTAWVPELSATR